ncbi:MAG: M23 family metallopeptidase [Candidatus Moraniibacteriota bacterium]|nr:MAG: M23 family metallopeptidase [Candidatus Moranbacteria bacterium]
MRSTQKGEVIKSYSGDRSGYGKYVEVRHAVVSIRDKPGVEFQLVSKYAHAESLQVSIGDHIRSGQVIGLMGNTGNFSSSSPCNHPGTHLHFVLYWDRYEKGVFKERVGEKPVVLFPYNYNDLNRGSSKFYSETYDIGKSEEIAMMQNCDEMYPICRDDNGDGIVDGSGGSSSDTDKGGGGAEDDSNTAPVSSHNADITVEDRAFRLNPDGTNNGSSLKANCRTCLEEVLTVGETIKYEGVASVANANVSDSLRPEKKDSKKIEFGFFFSVKNQDGTTYKDWWRGAEIGVDIDRLRKGKSPEFSFLYETPNLPGKKLEMWICADTDDEVLEPEEGDKRNPVRTSRDCRGNNRSKMKTFTSKARDFDYVLENAGMINEQRGYLWLGESYRLWYEVHASGADIPIEPVSILISRTGPEEGKKSNLLLASRTLTRAELTTGSVFLDQLSEVFSAPMIPGTYWFHVCVHSGKMPESNSENNCRRFRKEVRDPDVSITHSMIRCPVFTPVTWGPPWSSNPQYAPPFDEKGALVITPWCLESSPDYLEVFFRGSQILWVHKDVYILNIGTNTLVRFTADTCTVPREGGSKEWCPGTATLFIAGQSVDTALSGKNTRILAWMCRKPTEPNGTWTCGWRLQEASIRARQGEMVP